MIHVGRLYHRVDQQSIPLRMTMQYSDTRLLARAETDDVSMRQRLDKVDTRMTRASRRMRADVGALGPGLITGVADDDPSGISTYTVTGATQGYQLLWLSIVTLPMIIAVQSICARIGIVRGQGLAQTIGERYGRGWLIPVVGLLFIANVVNIGADILAIAAVTDMLTSIPTRWLVAPIGIGIALVQVIVPYPRFARYLKVLTLVIFAYVIGAFFANPDWGAALRGTFVPAADWSGPGLQTIVAVLGTTISPYLFFWQASAEVEEEEQMGIVAGKADPEEISPIIRGARLDISLGMLLSNIGFYFVVLTSAATLFASGQTNIQTAEQAAEALRPLAGNAASILFAVGIIGTGLLAIPTMAGSVAYAAAELFGWPEGLNNTFRRAPQFYSVIALATLLGIAMTFTSLGEIRALYLSAILNGLIAPLLLVVIMLLAGDRAVLGQFTAGRTVRFIGWTTTIAMLVVAIVMLIGLIPT
ncbi:MAG TPA: iron transporter [Chloroflexi bacterium]|nr:iron transporter [Chloroflexota bacterium]